MGTYAIHKSFFTNTINNIHELQIILKREETGLTNATLLNNF